MENLKSLEGKRVRVFEATYNHSSFAAPICIAGKCTFVDVENGWIALDDDKIFNFKFLNRIEVVGENSSKNKKKEKELQRKMEKKAKKEARKRKALFKKEKVETIIEKPVEKTEETEKEEVSISDEVEDFEHDMGEDEEE